MRTSETTTFPIAGSEYSNENERRHRRLVEQAFSNLRIDVIENRDMVNKPASLSLKRHQFLLMGGV